MIRSQFALSVLTRLGALGVIVAIAATADAQETVTISVPQAVEFQVTDVSRITAGTPTVTTISFSNATLNPGKALRVSVQSDGAAFTPPGGPGIAVSNVSWSNLGANGGIGWNGTLSSSAYTLVYQSDPTRTWGHIDLGWTLAAPGSGIRAGNHHLMIRWKVESIAP